MARSKSPARAKSPARKSATKAKAAASPDLGTKETQLGIALAVVVAAWFLGSGGSFEPSLPGLAAAASGGFKFNYPEALGIAAKFIGSSCNLVLILHVFNCISSNRSTSGYFMNNFVQLNLTTFAGIYVPKIMQGGSIFENTFHDEAGFSFCSFFLAWYIINYDIPFCPAPLGIWDKVSGLGGDALTMLMEFGTVMFTTNLVVAACSDTPPFSTAFFKTTTLAIVTGTATEFFPFNKGIKFVKSASHYNAGSIALFLCGGGFGLVDFFVGIPFGLIGMDSPIPAVGGMANGAIVGVFGSLANFVVVVTIINFFFGEYIPMRTNEGFDLFGLTSKLFGLAQLNY